MSPPLAIVKPTDDSSWSVPRVIITTKSRVSLLIVIPSVTGCGMDCTGNKPACGLYALGTLGDNGDVAQKVLAWTVVQVLEIRALRPRAVILHRRRSRYRQNKSMPSHSVCRTGWHCPSPQIYVHKTPKADHSSGSIEQ